MLLQLNIKNFALIESLSISFDQGFNILTGETGAGKSILIDAINFVLGGKFSKDLIRTGEDKTYVEAVFALENDKTKEVLKKYDLEFDDMLIMSRETFISGKSVAKVNDKALLLSSIKDISSTLLDIHGQHDNQELLDAANHIDYLDFFGGEELSNKIMSYKEKYVDYLEILDKINKLEGNDGEKEKLVDFYKYQLEEIKKANLKKGEDVELESQYSILSNAEKINKTLNSCYEVLSTGGENVISVYDSLSHVIKELRSIQKHIDKTKSIADSMEEAYYNIEQNIEEIRKLKESIVYDENTLEYINNRIYQISQYKKKYGKTIEDILEYGAKIEKQYNELVNSSEIIEKLKKEKKVLYSSLKEIAGEISKHRINASAVLEAAVKKELNYIGLEKSVFKIEVLSLENLNENGENKVQFLISTNPGEPLKPMEKVVSGGELSRIMLALKTVFIDKDMIPSVIFDEIDVGISGRIAQSVAEKMYAFSEKHQVFCITHLPQIACMSDIHYLIQKESSNGKTFTYVKKMNFEERKQEIARMVGGAEVTNLTLQHAEELIKMADNKKRELKK